MPAKRKHITKALSRYWPQNEHLLESLPMACQVQPEEEPLPPVMRSVSLPEWGKEAGVSGELLVPAWAVCNGEGEEWKRVDWLAAAFWFLNGSAERSFEKTNGPIHSYSFCLKGWDQRIWERAWVNRIALFLRSWAAREEGKDEETLFGPLPNPEIVLTHDVDAVSKTLAIRLKQSAFHGFNALRSILRFQLKTAILKAGKAVSFLVGSSDYWCFPQIIELEERHGVKSHFNFFGGVCGSGRSLKHHLMNPAYDVSDPRLKELLGRLADGGWTVGLHQSFDTWSETGVMEEEKAKLDGALGKPVTSCRQHWLRFSWAKTWKAQQEAGFKLDTTLGFNDRPGFRNGAALESHPWNSEGSDAMEIRAIPMVFMDSHFYDYETFEDKERFEQINYWIDEIRSVGGTATVIWHQRVMSDDYRWGEGYEYLLSTIAGIED